MHETVHVLLLLYSTEETSSIKKTDFKEMTIFVQHIMRNAHKNGKMSKYYFFLLTKE